MQPLNSAGTPSCQLSIKRKTTGESAWMHSDVANLHLQLFLLLAVHHNYIPQDPVVKRKLYALPPCDTLHRQPGVAAIACRRAGQKKKGFPVRVKAESLDWGATKNGEMCHPGRRLAGSWLRGGDEQEGGLERKLIRPVMEVKPLIPNKSLPKNPGETLQACTACVCVELRVSYMSRKHVSSQLSLAV